MDGRRGHVRAGRHRSHGKLLVEIEMGSVRLVRENEHARRVRDLHDLDEVRADAVVGRVVDEDRLGVRMRGDRLLHVLDAHAERDAEALVRARVDVDGDRAADDERVDGAAVHVARQDDLVAGAAAGHDHRLYGGGGAVHHEERVVRAERLGGELLGLLDDGNRVAQVVQGLHGVDIHGHGPCAKIFSELRVPAAALVGGNVKVGESVDPLLIQRIRQRRQLLIHVPSP